MSDSTQKGEDRLLSLLKHALDESDPVPTDVTDYAKATLNWRAVDGELAQLSFDSSERSVPAGVRSLTVARMLSFEAGGTSIVIEYNSAARRLMGQIEPPLAVAVELHLGQDIVATESDELGRFSFDGVVLGPIALVVRLSDEVILKTEWIVL